MEETIRVELKAIRFQDSTPDQPIKDPLKYPIYGNLLADRVIDEHHHWLQLEPAFQFSNADDLERRYEFRFHLAADKFFFGSNGQGKPIFWEARNAEMPCVTEVYFPEDGARPTICAVVVDPGHWGADRVITLRLLCRTGEDGDEINRLHGVSLSLIGHGHDAGGLSTTYFTPPGGKHLRIEATVPDQMPPTYDIFHPDFPVPPGLSLEPAFRVTAGRASVAVKIHLTNANLRFKTVPGSSSEVEVGHPSDSEMPAELSRVECSDEGKTAFFSWHQSPFVAKGIFDFSLRVVRQQAGNSGETVTCADIDPVLFNDPPPIGPEYE